MNKFFDYLITGQINENMGQPNYAQLNQTIEQAMNMLHQMAPLGGVSPNAPITNQIMNHLAQASTLIRKLQ